MSYDRNMRQRTSCSRRSRDALIPSERIEFADSHGKHVKFCSKACSNAVAAATHYKLHRADIAAGNAKRRRLALA